MYKVPSYTEISHFRAPYKDSLMGFGAGPAAGPGPSVSVASLSAGGTKVVTGTTGISAKGAPAPKLASGKATPATSKPKIPTIPISASEVDKQAEYLRNDLTYLVNVAAYGPDPRLWQYKPQIAFSKRWALASAMLTDAGSQFRKDVRSAMTKLLRTYERSSVRAVIPAVFKRILADSMGWTFQSVITGTALDPKAALAGSKSIPKMWATESEAAATGVTAVTGQKPIKVSILPVPTQLAIEDALVADYAKARATVSLFGASGAVAGAVEKQAAKAEQKAATEAQKKADDALAKAKKENADLKQMLEDAKDAIRQPPAEPVVPPTPEVEPVVPEPPPEAKLPVATAGLGGRVPLILGAAALIGVAVYLSKKKET